MEAIILIGVGFVAGMYITTQISEWIEGKDTNKELIENIKQYDKKQKNV